LVGNGTAFSHATNEVGRLIVQLKRELQTSQQNQPSQAARVVLKLESSAKKQDDDWETF